jgi:hypothetical protein
MNVQKYRDQLKRDKLLNEIITHTFLNDLKNEKKRSREDLKDMYIETFKCKKKLKNVQWKQLSSEYVMLDYPTQRALIIIPENESKVFLVPQNSKHKMKVMEVKDFYVPTVPLLNKDVILYILKQFKGYEVLKFRTVCKNWNRLIINERSFWAPLNVTYEPKAWGNLPLYRKYIKHMFLNVNGKHGQVYEFIRNDPEFKKQLTDKNPYIWIKKYREKIIKCLH